MKQVNAEEDLKTAFNMDSFMLRQ